VKAIILAGGMNFRMGESTNGTIKCLLPIEDETILGRSIRLLKKNGVEDILLVVGYRSEDIKKKFGDSVRYLREPLYTQEGMLDSLYFALDEFNSEILFMYADSIFSERALKKIVASEKSDIVCLVSEKAVDDESEKVKIKYDKIIVCSKELPNEESNGEFAGIIKMNKQGSKQFKENIQFLKDSDAIQFKNVRDLITIIAESGIAVKYELVSGEDWMEIDFPEEYKFAKDVFINQINKIDTDTLGIKLLINRRIKVMK